MYYNVILKKENNKNYIEVSSPGDIISPYDVVNKIFSLKTKFKQNSSAKLNYIVFGKNMSFPQVKTWSNEEYKKIPKCGDCAKILEENVFTHSFSDKIFCSENCSNNNYSEISNKFEEEEHEFDL